MSVLSNIAGALSPFGRPFVAPRVGWRSLCIAAAISIALWQVVEYATRGLPDTNSEMMRLAATSALSAQREIARIKDQLGLLQPASVDPNRTGLIGPDWSEIATTIGDVSAKRTATNPDLAAIIIRSLRAQGISRGETVGLVLSGSFVGANMAAIAAVEAMGLRPVIVSSLGASMYGATDPEFTWLDMEAVLFRAGIFKSRSAAVVLGGESALANSLSETGREMLNAAAHRNGYSPLAGSDFRVLKQTALEVLAREAPQGLSALISAGGPVLSIGTCTDAYRLPSGIVRGKHSCQDGVPGLIHDFAALGKPVLHILNLRRLALDSGLPYDPVPLPVPGQNPKIYNRTFSP